MAEIVEDYVCPGESCTICVGGGEETDGVRRKDCQERYVIYKIESPEGVIYIGKTKSTLGHRMSQHRHAIKAGHGDGSDFIDYYREHDFEKAKITILAHAEDDDDLREKEEHYIEKYDAISSGLNMIHGTSD